MKCATTFLMYSLYSEKENSPKREFLVSRGATGIYEGSFSQEILKQEILLSMESEEIS